MDSNLGEPLPNSISVVSKLIGISGRLNPSGGVGSSNHEKKPFGFEGWEEGLGGG
jgi:hypothetical protein